MTEPKRKAHPRTEVLEPSQDPIVTYRWGWYLMALFIPLAGILIGLFLYDQDSKEARKVGRNSLLIGFVLWVVFPLLILMVVLGLLLVTAANWVADMLPAAD